MRLCWSKSGSGRISAREVQLELGGERVSDLLCVSTQVQPTHTAQVDATSIYYVNHVRESMLGKKVVIDHRF